MPLAAHVIYFENAVGRLSEHTDGYALVQYHPGPRDFRDFQAFLTHLGNLLRRRGWHKVLSDQRALSAFTEQERVWIRQHWMQALQDTPTLTAVLLPEDVFARLSAHSVLHDTREGNMVYHLFEQASEAAAWLRAAP